MSHLSLDARTVSVTVCITNHTIKRYNAHSSIPTTTSDYFSQSPISYPMGGRWERCVQRRSAQTVLLERNKNRVHAVTSGKIGPPGALTACIGFTVTDASAGGMAISLSGVVYAAISRRCCCPLNVSTSTSKHGVNVWGRRGREQKGWFTFLFRHTFTTVCTEENTKMPMYRLKIKQSFTNKGNLTRSDTHEKL